MDHTKFLPPLLIILVAQNYALPPDAAPLLGPEVLKNSFQVVPQKVILHDVLHGIVLVSYVGTGGAQQVVQPERRYLSRSWS